MIYEKILKYLKLQLSVQCVRLHITNSQISKIIAKQALVYKKVLNGFASKKLLNYNLANIKVISAWKKQQTKAIIHISIIEQLYKEFHLLYHLQFSSFEKYA